MTTIDPIRFSGLASGLDTESIIKNLMKIETAKVDRQFQQKTLLEWKRDDYRSINNKLRTFREKNVFNLKLQGTFQAKSVSSSDETVLTATAGVGTLEGSYTVKVNQLAKGASVVSDKVDLSSGLTEGSFKIKGGEGTEEVEISVTAADTISDVLNKINLSSSKTGVSAMYDDNLKQIFLVSKATGEKAEINITVGSGDGTILTKLGLDAVTSPVKGQNAVIEFNGQTLSYDSNQFSLYGMNMTLKKQGQTVDITVGKDIDSIMEQIKGFIEQYNTIMDDIGTKLSEKRYRDYAPLTDEQKDEMEEKEIEKWEEKARSGLFRADTLLSSIYNDLRMTASSAVQTGSKYKTLSSIGITTSSNWNDNGKLYIDDEELREALTNDLDGVMKLFNGDSEDPQAQGIARKLDNSLLQHMESIATTAGRNTIGADESYLGKQISQMETRLEDMEDRLVTIEESYWAKFTAMEKALQQMQSQSSWITSQLGQS
jgi:flagellar hook-associated protein 2